MNTTWFLFYIQIQVLWFSLEGSMCVCLKMIWLGGECSFLVTSTRWRRALHSPASGPISVFSDKLEGKYLNQTQSSSHRLLKVNLKQAEIFMHLFLQIVLRKALSFQGIMHDKLG